MGFSQMLLNTTDLTEQQRTYVTRVCDYSDQLLHAINAIFDFVGLETETLSLNTEPFSVHQCVERAVMAAQQRTPYLPTPIVVLYENDPPDMIIHDEYRVGKMLLLWILAALHLIGSHCGGEKHTVPLIIHSNYGEPLPSLHLSLDFPIQRLYGMEQLPQLLANSLEIALLSRFSRLLGAMVKPPIIHHDRVSFTVVLPYQPIPDSICS